MFACDLSAQEIEFATKDGQHKIRGTVASFIGSNGDATKLPRSITPTTQVVIKRQDGTTTSPIEISKFSDRTQAAITRFVIRARRGSPDDKPETDKPSSFFLDNRQQLLALADNYSELGPIDQVDPDAKEQYLSDLRAFRKELGPKANSDWAVRFTLAYLAGEYGADKYGEMYLLAKDTKQFWIAWQTAIIFSLRYRGKISDCVRLMDQHLAELTAFRKQEAIAPNRQKLEKAGHAALWLREAAKLVESSGLADDVQLKRLKQIQVSATVTTLIKTSEIPDAVLEEVENRRRASEEERRKAEEEANRIKQLELDKRINACRQILDQFILSFEDKWQTGRKEFDRQEIVTRDAQGYYNDALTQWQAAHRNYVHWSRIASQGLEEDASSLERSLHLEAEHKADKYYQERKTAGKKKDAAKRYLYMARQRLVQMHYILANFVNLGKNRMFLFESHHLETIKEDEPLKQVYLDFTDKLKVIIAKFPPMPTVMIPPKNNVKLEAAAISQAQKEKVNDLSFFLTVDIQTFLDQLAAP